VRYAGSALRLLGDGGGDVGIEDRVAGMAQPSFHDRRLSSED